MIISIRENAFENINCKMIMILFRWHLNKIIIILQLIFTLPGFPEATTQVSCWYVFRESELSPFRVSIDLGNGLAPNRCQAITWTSADLVPCYSPYIKSYGFPKSPTQVNCWHVFRIAVYSQGYQSQRYLGNGLAPNICQAITWTNADLVHWYSPCVKSPDFRAPIHTGELLAYVQNSRDHSSRLSNDLSNGLAPTTITWTNADLVHWYSPCVLSSHLASPSPPHRWIAGRCSE